MKNNSPGMGMKKHAQSGRAGKSPSMRAYMKREAERNEIKARGIKNPVSSVNELFHGKRK